MNKTELLMLLDKIAPLDLSEEWDNSGIQIDLGKQEINKVLIALETDRDVVKTARESEADMIITHHPLFFPKGAVDHLISSDVNQKNIIELIQSGIEVVSLHTCYDAAPGCMNDCLCDLLGIKKPKTFAGNIPRIGRLAEPVTLSEYEKTVFERLGRPSGVLVGGAPEKLIRTVAVCSGAGGEFWKDALNEGADLFISGEIKHHEMDLIRQTNMAFIAAGHAGSEWIFVPALASQIRRMCLEPPQIIEYNNKQIPFDRVL